MPLQQFDERIMDVLALALDSTYTPGSKQTIPTNNSYDERIDVLQAVNTDTVAHELSIWLDNAPTAHGIGSVTLPAGAGTGAIPAVDVFAALLPASFHYLYIQSGGAFYASVAEAISSGKNVYVWGLGGGF